MNEDEQRMFRYLFYYEVYGSPWAWWIGIGWVQDLAVKYYLWKTHRKFKKFLKYNKINLL